jgi:hypothetical protein
LKKFYIFAVVFLFMGFYVNAQDLITLNNGSVIAGKVFKKSSSEIRYKPVDKINGRMLAVPISGVYAISYENGTVDIINPGSGLAVLPFQPGSSAAKEQKKSTFGLSADIPGFLILGPTLYADITKGTSNTQIFLHFPGLGGVSKFKETDYANYEATDPGIGVGLGLNRFYPGGLGGFYWGIMFEGAIVSTKMTRKDDGKLLEMDRVREALNIYGALALDAGYKFIFKQGLYIRTGFYIGADITTAWGLGFLFRPDLSVGWVF